jgi:putative membrane protein
MVPVLARIERERVVLLTGVLSTLSLAVVFGAVGGIVPRSEIPRAPDVFVALIPHVNAMLSLTAIAAIATGVWHVRRGDVANHRRAMVTAVVLFATFLGLYLYRVAVHGPTSFGGPEAIYTYLYVPLLIVHVGLAVVCIPLLYYVLLLGLTRPVAHLPETPHPRIGRIAATLWAVSFAMGIAVYGLLYWIFPPA